MRSWCGGTLPRAVHVGIAIRVAARPGAEVQDGRHVHCRGGGAVDLAERLGDLLIERRHHLIEDLEQVEQDLLALVGDREPFTRQFLGLPCRGHLQANAGPDIALLVGRDRRIEPRQQPLRDALLLAQQRAAVGIGGMRGEHRVDRQRAEELEHLGKRPALALQGADRILDSARLGALTVLEEVVAAAADAMHPLGEIDRLEPGGEGAHQVTRQRRRAVAHAGGELDAGIALPAATADRGYAVQLHELIELRAALLAQDFPDQPTEGMHVVA
jgi:hypothetical protein